MKILRKLIIFFDLWFFSHDVIKFNVFGQKKPLKKPSKPRIKINKIGFETNIVEVTANNPKVVEIRRVFFIPRKFVTYLAKKGPAIYVMAVIDPIVPTKSEDRPLS